MKILFTLTGDRGTGSSIAIESIAKELLLLGHEVKILLPSLDKQFDDSELPDLFEIWHFPITAIKNNKKIILSSFPLMLPDPHPKIKSKKIICKLLSKSQFEFYLSSFSKKFTEVVTAFKPDIIESEHIWAMGYIIAHLGYKYLIGAHHSDQIAFHYDKRMQAYAKFAAQNSEYVITATQNSVPNLAKMYQINSDKIAVINNGYDNHIFKPEDIDIKHALQILNLPVNLSQEIFVAYPGRMALNKGFDIVLRAAEYLYKNNITNIHFLLFGSLGNIKEFCQEHLLLDIYNNLTKYNIHILGYHPQKILAMTYNFAKIAILPSREEGFSIALLEAMGCGLPAIAAENTGPEEFVVGKIIEQNSPGQLAEAIINIINLSPQQYQELSTNAFQVVQQYTWKNNALKRLQYYNKLLKI